MASGLDEIPAAEPLHVLAYAPLREAFFQVAGASGLVSCARPPVAALFVRHAHPKNHRLPRDDREFSRSWHRALRRFAAGLAARRVTPMAAGRDPQHRRLCLRSRQRMRATRRLSTLRNERFSPHDLYRVRERVSGSQKQRLHAAEPFRRMHAVRGRDGASPEPKHIPIADS